MSYATWLSKVDDGLLSTFEIGVFSLSDIDFLGYFESNMTPEEACNEIIEMFLFHI
jgi:hypothetical protein